MRSSYRFLVEHSSRWGQVLLNHIHALAQFGQPQGPGTGKLGEVQVLRHLQKCAVQIGFLEVGTDQ